MGRNIIVWSGGADSTALLDYYAGCSSEDYPVKAISISKHPNLVKGQTECEGKARKRYLELARSRGYWIEHEEIEFGDGFSAHGPEGAGPPGQMMMWMCAITPCVSDGDSVMFAYIKGDAMWHYKYEFVNAFDAIMKLKGVNAKIEFPFEWNTKIDIFDILKKANISSKHWWSCERPRKNGTRCGKCNKCKEKG
jgi:hypothetical protein